MKMSYLRIEELRKAMSEKKVEWEASPNEISDVLIDAPESSSLFGLSITEDERIKLVKESEGAEPERLFAAPPPPPRIDWRNHNGQNWVTDIKHQKNCGSCVSFATCATLESRCRITTGNSGLAIDLSEAHLFFCGAGQACGRGWNFDPAMIQCQTEGVGAESQFPYTPQNQPCQHISPIVKVTTYDREVTQDARMRAIATNGPVLAGMRVFEDFHYYRGGVYRHVIGVQRGLHAVCVVGYDNIDRYWIVKNSWGHGWGEQGFFRIAFGECGLDGDFPFYDPDVNYIGGSPIS